MVLQITMEYNIAQPESVAYIVLCDYRLNIKRGTIIVWTICFMNLSILLFVNSRKRTILSKDNSVQKVIQRLLGCTQVAYITA